MAGKRKRPNISVSIEIDGPVINSTITGISSAPKRTTDPIFGRTISEYLILPALQGFAARIHRTVSTAGKDLRTFDFSKHGLEYLWQSMLQDQYRMAPPSTFTDYSYDDPEEGWLTQHGTHVRKGGIAEPVLRNQWLVLKNLQICPFVNRSPGRFYRGGWNFGMGKREVDEDRLLVSTNMWTWEDYAVRAIGIGDVRMPKQGGYYLMQATTAEGANTDLGVDFYDPTYGGHYAGGAAISALGFPILISETLYDRFDYLITMFGAVAIDSLTVRLVQAPDDSGLLWGPGVSKAVLIAQDDRAAAGISAPLPAFNAAWTVAVDDSFSAAHYCTWGFCTGIIGFRAELERATKVITGAIKERGLHACFEFDYETNWFGDSCLFSVSDMAELAAKIPPADTTNDAVRMVDYATYFDDYVERETGLDISHRNGICIAIAEIDSSNFDRA